MSIKLFYEKQEFREMTRKEKIISFSLSWAITCIISISFGIFIASTIVDLQNALVSEKVATEQFKLATNYGNSLMINKTIFIE